MSAAAMEWLAAARGDAFSRRWMQMMVEHHRGALGLVEQVQADGDGAELRELADAMASAQEAQVRGLERWLAAR